MGRRMRKNNALASTWHEGVYIIARCLNIVFNCIVSQTADLDQFFSVSKQIEGLLQCVCEDAFEIRV